MEAVTKHLQVVVLGDVVREDRGGFFLFFLTLEKGSRQNAPGATAGVRRVLAALWMHHWLRLCFDFLHG